MKKINLLFINAFVAIIVLSSCAHGPSDATKQAVAEFEVEWTTFASTANAWGDSINNAISTCENSCKSMMDECTKSCSEKCQKACDSTLKASCGKDMETFKSMQQQMKDAVPMMETTLADFNAFKEKVNKGEINDEEAMKQLGEFKTKLASGQTMAADWQTKFAEAKSSCMKNLETCMSSCKMMENKDDKKKK